MFDLTDAHSFSSVEYWVKTVRERAADKVQIGIVGNKADKTSERVISREDGESLAKKLNCLYTETSVEDFASIQAAFGNLVNKIGEIILSEISEQQDAAETSEQKDDTASNI